VLNIFSYNTNTYNFTQAKRPKQIIYASPKWIQPEWLNPSKQYMHYWNGYWYQNADFSWALVGGFGKRVGNIIRMTSSYGDAGCWSERTWWYNFRTNTMSLIKSDSGCSN
jgi:hypothetical protein